MSSRVPWVTEWQGSSWAAALAFLPSVLLGVSDPGPVACFPPGEGRQPLLQVADIGGLLGGTEDDWVSAHPCGRQSALSPHLPTSFLPQVPVLLTSGHITGQRGSSLHRHMRSKCY